MAEFDKIISTFNLKGNIKGYSNYGSGHINGTYRITCEYEGKDYYYILQNINASVFKNPDEVMDNILKVTDFLKKKSTGNCETLNFIKCENGTLCYIDEKGDYWRMYEFISGADGVDRPNLEEFYECGYTFGRFQSLLSDFPAETLFETIPDFHDTAKRYKTFLAAIDNNLSGRKDNVTEEIEFVKAREDFYPTLFEANAKGILPLRVSHNDTKSNNVLLDHKTRKGVCVIDLDTIMPGFSVTDFGDAIRFGASTADEDEKDLSKVWFDMDKFRIYAKGFIEGCGGKLPIEEIKLLPEGALMMTLECGMRFLTDYLDGDTYFKVSYPEHNLVRARTQFKLASEMEKHWDEMKAIVAEFIKA